MNILNPELLYLKPLLNKEYYNKYKEYIDYKYLKEYYREISFLYSTLAALHEANAGNLSVADLVAGFWSIYPEADKTVYEGLLKALEASEITEEVGRYALDQIIARKRLLKLSELAFQVSQGLKKQEELDSFLKDDHPTIVELPLSNVSTDLEVLLEEQFASPGLRWRLDGLNKSLGSLRPGDFGFIFARPETGKTTFLASETTCFLQQAEGPVIWFNNEEQGNKVMLRIYQAYFGVSLEHLLANPKLYKEEFTRRVGSNFYLFDSATISRSDVEKTIKRLNPRLVIYDQIDKIKGFTADRPDLTLGAIYQWARELAKNSHSAIGVCQADGTAEGVRYLTMEHVANAKTSKQAEADFIVGIGKSHEANLEFARYFNICKNKLTGDKDSIPDLRHGKLEVLIRPDIARYEDVIKFE